MTKRIMVDMSATLIHHGHIRLLKKASEFGEVIQLQGDQRENVKKFLILSEMAHEDIIKVHGF